jgi:hypothetical protein
MPPKGKTSMRRRRGSGWARVLIAVLPAVFAVPAFAVSCTTQSQMTPRQRNGLRQASILLAQDVRQGNVAALQARTIAPVAKSFSGIASSVEQIQPDLTGATLTVDNLYLLDASDLKNPTEADFFCGLNNSDLLVTITIPALPPGRYALAITHATGVPHPRQISMVLQNQAPSAAAADWKLAGFFARPMTMAGHDGVWYWKQARDYAQQQKRWDAWFYYQTAKSLLAPVDFLSSPNLRKLDREANAVRPDGLPGTQPMQLSSGGHTYEITDLYAGHLSGQLDLVVTYKSAPIQDPVAARAQVVAVMRALLTAHPELKQAFHGFWVHVATPGDQTPFALELPIDQIESTEASPRLTQRIHR